jgi:hypothetical protein
MGTPELVHSYVHDALGPFLSSTQQQGDEMLSNVLTISLLSDSPLQDKFCFSLGGVEDTSVRFFCTNDIFER